MLVGEAPGATEDEQGRPFVGRAGKLLDELLAEAGLEREDVYITNVVKARPPGNRDPKAGEVAHHMPWLEAELALDPAAPGDPARPPRARATSPTTRRSPTSTAPRWTARGRALFPMYHPAAALRGQGMREALFEDARKLKERSRREAVARRARSSRRRAGW